MYFTTLSTPSAAAQALVQRRAGKIVNIAGADGFFDELAQKVETIEEMRKPHPLSAELAVALMKEYIPEAKHRIRLHDLVAKEIARAADAMAAADLPTQDQQKIEETFVRRTNRFVSLLGTLVPMAYTAGVWASEEQSSQWFNAIIDFSKRPRSTNETYVVLSQLQALPAILLLYSFGVGAIVGKQYALLGKLLSTEIDFGYETGRMALGEALNIVTTIDNGDHLFKLVPGYGRYGWPGNDLIADVLRPHTRGELRTDEAFDDAFSRFELALTFLFAERRADEGHDWIPRGRFAQRSGMARRLITEWEAEAAANKETNSLRLMAGLKNEPRFDHVAPHVGARR